VHVLHADARKSLTQPGTLQSVMLDREYTTLFYQRRTEDPRQSMVLPL